MRDACDEFIEMLKRMPTYKSWTPSDLEKLFDRYKEIIIDLIASEDYKNYRQLADSTPDLSERIHSMLVERAIDKQSRSFNNIVFELQCAIEVLAEKLECDEPDVLKLLISRNIPKAA